MLTIKIISPCYWMFSASASVCSYSDLSSLFLSNVFATGLRSMESSFHFKLMGGGYCLVRIDFMFFDIVLDMSYFLSLFICSQSLVKCSLLKFASITFT
jgi:hypothetical protein